MNKCDNCGDLMTCSCVGLPPTRLADQLDLMRDEFKRIIALMSSSQDERDAEVIGICERAIAVTEQTVPVIVQRDNAIREMEACHKCWDDFTAKVATVMPQAKNWPLFSHADAIVDLGKAASALVELVEGPGCVRWEHEGLRFKDTKEWARFYVVSRRLTNP